MNDEHDDAVHEADAADEKRRADYKTACGFADQLAGRFLAKLEPVDAGGVMIGCGINVLVNGLGKASAVRYLRDLALELERDRDPTTTVN